MSESGDFEKLYTDCAKCNGTGSWIPPRSGNTTYGPRTCPDCDGIGAIPTAKGKPVLDLIKRWRQSGRL
jgi:DnaJ-class molecular chaperone